METELTAFFQQFQIKAIPLCKKERIHVQQAWRETFASEVKRKTGKWVINNANWHAFTYHFTFCLTGARGGAAFDRIGANAFYFVSSN